MIIFQNNVVGEEEDQLPVLNNSLINKQVWHV